MMKNFSGRMFESNFMSHGHCNECFHKQEKMESLQILIERP